MGNFEAECALRGRPLKAPPPRRPQLNGIVERANRTARSECQRFCGRELNCAAMNEALGRCLDYCSNRQPHRSLGMKTPAELTRVTEVAVRPQISKRSVIPHTSQGCRAGPALRRDVCINPTLSPRRFPSPPPPTAKCWRNLGAPHHSRACA